MTQLHVNQEIERSLGNRFEIRFWLSTEINGRKVESRGTIANIEQPTVADARLRSSRMAAYAQMRIDNEVADGLTPKGSDAALKAILDEYAGMDSEWDEIVKSFNS